MIYLADLLNFVTLHVRVGLSDLSQFLSEIHTVLNSEGARLAACFDIRDAFNLRQIASNRGGTATSRHPWCTKRDQGQIRVFS